MRTLLACLVLLLTTSVANAAWQEKVFDEKYQIKVYPAPTWEVCDHGSLHLVQPAPYWEERTRTVRQWYWVADPQPIYVHPQVYSTSPIYVCPQTICVCPQTYVCPQPTYFYSW